jgi:hypothetical protein
MKHQEIFHWWQRERPRFRELGAAIKDTAHPQEVEGIAEWVGHWRQHDIHVIQYAQKNALRPVSVDKQA